MNGHIFDVMKTCRWRLTNRSCNCFYSQTSQYILNIGNAKRQIKFSRKQQKSGRGCGKSKEKKRFNCIPTRVKILRGFRAYWIFSLTSLKWLDFNETSKMNKNQSNCIILNILCNGWSMWMAITCAPRLYLQHWAWIVFITFIMELLRFSGNGNDII